MRMQKAQINILCVVGGWVSQSWHDNSCDYEIVSE